MNVTILEVNVKPEMRDRYIEVATALAKGCAENEPGCARFDVLQDKDNPNLFYYYEVFWDDDGQAAHQKTPHHDLYVEQIGECLDEKGRIGHRTRSVFSGDAVWTSGDPVRS